MYLIDRLELKILDYSSLIFIKVSLLLRKKKYKNELSFFGI